MDLILWAYSYVPMPMALFLWTYSYGLLVYAYSRDSLFLCCPLLVIALQRLTGVGVDRSWVMTEQLCRHSDVLLILQPANMFVCYSDCLPACVCLLACLCLPACVLVSAC